MFQSMQAALNAYTKRPLFFIFNSFLYIFFQLLITLAIVGVLLVGVFIASSLNYSVTSFPMVFFYSILLVVFFYFTVAFHGTLIRSYWDSLNDKPTELLNFYRYALDNGFRFFWIFVAQLAIDFVFLAPLILLYLYVLRTLVFPYIDTILILVACSIMSVAHFLFFGAFVAAAIYDLPAGTAVKSHFRFLRRRHFIALIFYFIYGFVLLTNAIPLIQVISLLAVYPIVLTALIYFFDAAVGKERGLGPRRIPKNIGLKK